MTQANAKPRGRDLGLPFVGKTGPFNAITDVPGVEVGMYTRCEPGSTWQGNKGPVRTGVTTIFPRGRAGADQSVWAGQFSFNGNGEMTGTHWIHDAGYFSGPMAITNSHSVGMVHHGLTHWMIENVEAVRSHHHWFMPVVAETYDGATNDINGQHIGPEHVAQALDSARSGPVAEGNVGGGTGMMCYEFKGGTGTASRCVEIEGQQYTVGALVQANFGARQDLQILGVPIGQLWPEDAPLTELAMGETGSVVVVVATDAPLNPVQLKRLAKRGCLGITRTGTTGGVNSGDLMLAFSTANTRRWASAELHHGAAVKPLNCLEDNLTDELSRATALACEESVINAMLAAQDMSLIRPLGKTYKAIDHERLLRLMREHRAMT
ncbi:DmpA family aminopeptidase [Roseateles koreensis]|uniref:P1 family peptidase n=1 Tax=Roseateles koreensis TaxID=2987526 RepID=A0ABT5KTX0_9BURK|nr:P1 family peptidase [Roseateles koreensis]MDC8786390.1 P1 family peptidase [Roseateles koreensis]